MFTFLWNSKNSFSSNSLVPIRHFITPNLVIFVHLSDFCENLICYSPHKLVRIYDENFLFFTNYELYKPTLEF